MSDRGVYITFLGVDGIGKTTLCRQLATVLRSRDLEVVEVTWRGQLTGENVWPTRALQELWVETFRLIYAGVQDKGVEVEIPRDYAAWIAESWEDQLADSNLAASSATGPLAAALVELAGNVVLASEVIGPAVRAGKIVLQDTFPYKHVLKEILLCEFMLGRADLWTPMCGMLKQFARTFFASPGLAPDVGVLVEGPLELAYKWRIQQNARLGVLEDYSAAGEGGEASYEALQRASSAEFGQVAAEWNWLHHLVDDSGMERNLERGLSLILRHPKLANQAAVQRMEGFTVNVVGSADVGETDVDPLESGSSEKLPYEVPQIERAAIHEALLVPRKR